MENTLMLKFELFTKKEKKDKWGWRLVNYQPFPNKDIASSILVYPTKKDCIEAIQHIKECIPLADIDERGL